MSADEPWLDRVYGADDDAIDLIYDRVDDMLIRGEFTRCNRMLATLDVERLSVVQLLAFMSITRPASVLLPNRVRYVQRAIGLLSAIEPHRVGVLVNGLV